MKQIKKLGCLLMVTALLFTCTGCDIGSILSQLDFTPAVTKDSVLLKLTETVNGRAPTAANVELEISAHTDIGDLSLSLSSSAAIASETDSYAEGEANITINGVETSDSAQIYNLAENGKLLTFTHVDSRDLWFRSETDLPTNQPEATPMPTPAPAEDTATTSPTPAPEIVIPEAYKFLLLEEGTQTVDGKQVYMLTGTLDGEACLDLLQNSLQLDALTARIQALAGSTSATSDLKALNFSDLSADVVLYLHKSDCSPAQIELTINSANLLLTDLLNALPPQVHAALGNHVSLQSVHVTFSDINFDPVTIPTIPEDARIRATQEAFVPAQADGSFVLMQHTDAVKFTPQAEFRLSEQGPSYISFRNGDNTCAIHLELYSDTSGESFVSLVEAGLTPAMETAGLVPVSAAAEPIGDYQTHSITSNGVNVYIAHRNIGDSLLGIYVEDNTGRSLTAIMTPILDAIENHQITY